MSKVGLVPFAGVTLEVSQEVVPVSSHRLFRSLSLSRNCWRFCA